MALTDEQPATRLEQSRNRDGPARDARQPAESADAGKDEVELFPTQSRHCVVDVGLDVVHVIAGPRDQGTRLLDRDRREVQPSHPGAETGQADRVGADVTLQMDPAKTAHVTEQGAVEPHHMADVPGVVDETLNVVVRRGRVRRRPLIPVGSVDVPVVVHLRHPGTVPGTVSPRTGSSGVAGTSIAGRPAGADYVMVRLGTPESCATPQREPGGHHGTLEGWTFDQLLDEPGRR